MQGNSAENPKNSLKPLLPTRLPVPGADGIYGCNIPADSGASIVGHSITMSSYQPTEQTELPKLAHPQPRRSRVNRLIFLSTVGFATLLGVIVVMKLVQIRSGKGQSTAPRSLAILPLPNRGDSTSSFHGVTHSAGICSS